MRSIRGVSSNGIPLSYTPGRVLPPATQPNQREPTPARLQKAWEDQDSETIARLIEYEGAVMPCNMSANQACVVAKGYELIGRHDRARRVDFWGKAFHLYSQGGDPSSELGVVMELFTQRLAGVSTYRYLPWPCKYARFLNRYDQALLNKATKLFAAALDDPNADRFIALRSAELLFKHHVDSQLRALVNTNIAEGLRRWVNEIDNSDSEATDDYLKSLLSSLSRPRWAAKEYKLMKEQFRRKPR